MNARRAALLGALATMAASGAYVFVYLYRWEWNRALISAAIFIAAEVGLLGMRMGERLGRLERQLAASERAAELRRLEVLRASAPPAGDPFAWLRVDRTNVFIPVLLGAGVVLSAVAWVVERFAQATAGRAVERGLARGLGALEPPAGGLLATGDDPLAPLRGPLR